MNTAEELRAVRKIRHKQRKRLQLTPAEWVILAYSPFASGGGCPSTVGISHSPKGQGGDMK